MRIFRNIETKRLGLLVIAMMSTPIFFFGLSLTYFWFAVILNSSDYVKAVFEVNKVGFVRYGSTVRYEVATGKVDEAEEVLYAWCDYFKTRDQALAGSGQHLSVMYNPKAPDFHFGGRNLRVLSIEQFNLATYRLLLSLAITVVSPVIWLVYFRFGRVRRIGRKSTG